MEAVASELMDEELLSPRRLVWRQLIRCYRSSESWVAEYNQVQLRHRRHHRHENTSQADWRSGRQDLC